jgi:histidinol-phosphate aminotransferase
MDISGMVDEEVQKVVRVKKGKDFYEEMSEQGSIVRMGLNENMLVDRGFAGTLLQEAARRVDARKYPVPKGGLALKAIAERLGVWEDQVVVGNGSDEILDLIAKVFIGGGEALIVEPTFEMYRFYVGLSRGKAKSVMMTESFEMKADDVISSVTNETRAIFICSPNNPTGKQFSKDQVLRVVEESGKLVILDEAYADFAPYSLVTESTKYENLLVLRTFSKAFGLAGLRIGFGVGNSEIASWLRSAQSPFSVNIMAQEATRLVLENQRIYDTFVKQVIEERKYLKAELEMVNGVRAVDSDANFILFRVIGKDFTSVEVAKRLKEAGIEIRDRGTLPLLGNCLRVTVSTRENNLKFVKELKKAIGGPK